jgi:hypothetical protein
MQMGEMLVGLPWDAPLSLVQVYDPYLVMHKWLLFYLDYQGNINYMPLSIYFK